MPKSYAIVFVSGHDINEVNRNILLQINKIKVMKRETPAGLVLFWQEF